ncbi:MAG: hypothetical protein ACYC3V_07865 [Chloroflexota bacterium]
MQRYQVTWFSAVPTVFAILLQQAASRPLPPGRRKMSSVGLPTGVQIVAADDEGVPLPAGEEGELLLKGETITRGYFKNDAANAEAFLGPWFRTGDLGRIDEEGYVFITGRKKEQINRGGQKLSPREVDEVSGGDRSHRPPEGRGRIRAPPIGWGRAFGRVQPIHYRDRRRHRWPILRMENDG